MEENMKDNGKMISNMEEVKKYGIMGLKSIRVILLTAKSMEKEDLNGMTNHTMRVILKREFFMD
jgi:hypothetical protein